MEGGIHQRRESATRTHIRSVPAASNNRTTSKCGSDMAQISAVCPCSVTTSTSAPRSRRAFTISTLPTLAAFMSGGHAIGLHGVHIRPSRQERPNHRHAAVLACQVQCPHAVVVSGIDPCPCADQRLGAIHVIPMRGPHERRRAIGLRRVHISATLEQGADCLPVPLSKCVNKPIGILGARSGSREHKAQGHQEAHPARA